MIIASDGLWDMMSNQYAVDYVKSRLTEPHFGAKSLVSLAYNKNQLDNITVMIILFKDGRYEFGSSSTSYSHSTTK